MEKVLAPITPYSERGIAMKTADGIWCRCHPIFAIFVSDYPEQTLVTCTYNGRCPKCEVTHDQLGEYQQFPTCVHCDATNVYRLADDNVNLFLRKCREAGIKPVYHPFWQLLPFANIYQSITPDILHQLLQGIIRHLVAWLSSPTIFGPDDINARCRILPQNHSIALFPRGITTLSRVTGQEHKNMCRVLLGLIITLIRLSSSTWEHKKASTSQSCIACFIMCLPSYFSALLTIIILSKWSNFTLTSQRTHIG